MRRTHKHPHPPHAHPAGDIQCLAEAARTSSAGVNDYDDEGQTPLHIAADQGLPEAVSVLSSHGADINVPREEDNRTPLHIAVNEGHIEVRFWLGWLWRGPACLQGSVAWGSDGACWSTRQWPPVVRGVLPDRSGA